MKRLGLLLLAIALSGCMWMLGELLFGHIPQQLAARKFPTTSGTLDSVRVVEKEGDEDTTYRLEVAYRYTVDGRVYKGDRMNYVLASRSDSDEKWPAQYVSQHPVGSQVQVHYNPADHNDAVLQVGLQGNDFFTALFFSVFATPLAGLWIYCINGLVPLGRLKDALVAGVATLGCLTFPSVFVVAFGIGMHPSTRLMIPWWLVILGLTVWSFAAGYKADSPSKPR